MFGANFYRYERVKADTYKEFKTLHSTGYISDFISFPLERLNEFREKAKNDIEGGCEAIFLWAYFATYERKIDKDSSYALMEIFRLGIMKRYAECLYLLGLFYSAGYWVKRDAKIAFDMFTQSAALGLSTAHYQLGVFHFHALGVPQNLVKARQHFSDASDLKDPDAAAYLAIIDLISSQDRLQRKSAFLRLENAAVNRSGIALGIMSNLAESLLQR